MKLNATPVALLPAFAPLLIAGCAITSGHELGPNGRPIHFIDGMSARTAYQKANELCPHGYALIGMPLQTSLIDHVMTVECKDPPALRVQQPPAAAPAAQPAAAAVGGTAQARPPLQLGRDGWQADKAVRQAGCGSKAQASMTASGPGFEVYNATCIGGDVMTVRCEMGHCKVLQ